jgi:hypothetical protein
MFWSTAKLVHGAAGLLSHFAATVKPAAVVSTL